MMKFNRNAKPSTHPDATELDRLRVGLLDAEPEFKQDLLDHLARCGRCRRAFAMADRVRVSLEEDLEAHVGLRAQLRARRRGALAGEASGRSSRTQPLRWALAGAALSALLALGIFLNVERTHPVGPSMAVAQGEAVPDLYGDLDFYLWLARERAGHAEDGDRS